MLTKEQLREFAKDEAKRLKQLSDEEIKEEFIKSFGKEKWDEEEMLSKLIPLSFEISDYLGIDFIPILFDDTGEEDSRVYFEECFIAINPKFKNDFMECAKCICHELRHLYQMVYAATSTDQRALRIKNELANPIVLDPTDSKSITEYAFQEIEIDAYAFTKWYLKSKMNVDVIHPSKDYEFIINAYMNKYFN